MAAHVSQGKQDGVICDLCNTVMFNKFRYFDIKFGLIDVDVQNKNSSVVDKNILNLDVCPGCFEKMKATVIEHIVKRESHHE